MFEVLPHTADVRIRVRNASLEGVFVDAGRAIVALSEVETASDAPIARTLVVDSADRQTLLVDFLNELLAMLHVDRLAFERFESVLVRDTRLECVAVFRPAVRWEEDIKAATYHEAGIGRVGELWTTVVVIDI